jgi:hypothetical protein
MRFNTVFLATSMAISFCVPAFSWQPQATKTKEMSQTSHKNDSRMQNPCGPGQLIHDYGDYMQQQQQKPKPASGTHTAPGTATPTQTVPKPAKPTVVASPKPVNQGGSSSYSGNHIGSTQNGTVKLPNGTTVYKSTKPSKDLK